MSQMKSLHLNDGVNNLRIPVKKRILIGSSDTCDIRLKRGNVEPIHCLLELNDGDWKIFNLAPKSICRVNGKDIVSQVVKVGDKLLIGNREFALEEIRKEAPPVRDEVSSTRSDMPSLPPVRKSVTGQQVNEGLKKTLPFFETPEIFVDRKQDTTSNHPLARVKDAQYTEYIFEDQDEIYPIFKYSVDKTAAEVVIIFKDKILSVDYIPLKNGKYYLSGVDNNRDVAFAYLGKKEKMQILEVQNSEVYLSEIPGFEHRKFSDATDKGLLLGKDDIHIFNHGDIQIYVRGDEAPPAVMSAPIMRRDPELKKYLLLCFLFMVFFVGAMNLYQVDKELEKEKAPERIATILYKPKKLRISKQNEVVKEIVKDKPELKKTPEKSEVVVKDTAQKEEKSIGDVNSKSTNNNPKKGEPVKGPTNNVKTVTNTSKASGSPNKSATKSTKKAVSKPNNMKGNVDTYKSIDFSSSLSSLMAKGGSLSSATANSGVAVSYEDNNSLSSDESAQVQKANVSASVGSLTSQTKGKLESSFGTNGLVQKKQVYIAGVPYKEVILGSIDRNDIWRILLENVPQFQYCYQRELDSKSQALEGVLMLQFVIGPSGNVTRASATNKDNNLPIRTRDCVVNHLKTIQFPQPNGGSEVTVNTPLNLQANQR